MHTNFFYKLQSNFRLPISLRERILIYLIANYKLRTQIYDDDIHQSINVCALCTIIRFKLTIQLGCIMHMYGIDKCNSASYGAVSTTKLKSLLIGCFVCLSFGGSENKKSEMQYEASYMAP